MKKSKIVSAILALIIASASVLSLSSCGKGDEDVTKITDNVTKESVTAAPNGVTEAATDVKYTPNVTQPASQAGTLEEDLSRINEYATEPGGDGSFVTEIAAVKFVYPDYFADGNSYVAIRDIEVDDTGIRHNADAWVDFEVLARGANEDKVKISYIGYDADGNVTRRSQITVNLYGKNVGDIVEDCRMDFKRETVKIVFTEFVEITE